jgi:hypothetical protein
LTSPKDTSYIYKLRGMVRGNQLKGRVLGDLGTFPFIIIISSDGQSFEGKITSFRAGHIKGKNKFYRRIF